MARVSGIYEIRNIVNNKVYIGSAVDVRGRWYRHLFKLRQGIHSNRHLQGAFERYGENFFVWSLLEEAPTEVLVDVEQKWLDASRCCEPDKGYNMCRVAYSRLGCNHTEEAIARMSGRGNHMYGKRRSDETRAKLSKAHMGKVLSGETRRKISDALMGKNLSKEHRTNISAGHIGKKHSDETIAKISAGNIGKKRSDETRAKISAARFGRSHSVEVKLKISRALKVYYEGTSGGS